MSLTKAITVILLVGGLCVEVFGYPESHGPFPPGQEPAAIPRQECKLVSEKAPKPEELDGAVRHYRLRGSQKAHDQINVELRGASSGWLIEICDARGKRLMPTPVTNSMTSSQMEVFACELNQDGVPDFIINVWSGGVGLAAEGSEVTLLLSSKNGYRASSFYLYSFGKEDLVQFKSRGPVYFILNDLIRSNSENTRDGRDHNFWVYELYRIDGDRLIPADADQPGFPKWVWYSNKDSHEETTLLSQEQKIRLLKKRHAAR